MLAKITSKNQLTLPKSATQAVGASDYFDVEVRAGQIILTPVRIQRGDAVRAELAELDIGAADVADAVAWARSPAALSEMVAEPKAGYGAVAAKATIAKLKRWGRKKLRPKSQLSKNMSSPLRVVLDTNVVLSALVFGGSTAGRLRLAWQHGVFLPLASTATAQELVRVLGYPKFRLSPQEQEELLADYLPCTRAVRIPEPPPSVPACRDVMDLPFMQLAVAGRAQVLVSGDRDLLTLADEFEKVFACPIVTLDEFMRTRLEA